MPSSADRSGRDIYCLIGGNVSSSPSPAMMNAAFSQLSIAARYTSVSIDEGGLETQFAELRLGGVRGVNVTIPFKSSIIPLLESLDPVAAKIGAVNTIKRDGSRYIGYNTDVEGIVGPLSKFFREGELREAVLLGAGGAARAFIEAARRMGCGRVHALVREGARSSAFLAEMRSSFPAVRVTPHQLAEAGEIRISPVQLLFNASPVGSQGVPLPEPVRRIAADAMVVFDAVYRPVRTEIIVASEEAGGRVVHGYEMLLHQGAAAFELWTGRTAPFEVMRGAVMQSLGVTAS